MRHGIIFIARSSDRARTEGSELFHKDSEARRGAPWTSMPPRTRTCSAGKQATRSRRSLRARPGQAVSSAFRGKELVLPRPAPDNSGRAEPFGVISPPIWGFTIVSKRQVLPQPDGGRGSLPECRCLYQSDGFGILVPQSTTITRSHFLFAIVVATSE